MEIMGYWHLTICKTQLPSEGFPCRSVMIFRDYKNTPAGDTRTYWIQELAKREVLTAGYHIVSLSHTSKEINLLLEIYNDVFRGMKESLEDDSLSGKLQCPSVKCAGKRT